MCALPEIVGPLIEPTHIADVLVSGIAEIEAVGGCIARFTLYVDSKGLGEGAAPDRLVVDRIAIPIAALPHVIQQMLVFVAGQALTDLRVRVLAH